MSLAPAGTWSIAALASTNWPSVVRPDTTKPQSYPAISSKALSIFATESSQYLGLTSLIKVSQPSTNMDAGMSLALLKKSPWFVIARSFQLLVNCSILAKICGSSAARAPLSALLRVISQHTLESLHLRLAAWRSCVWPSCKGLKEPERITR